MSDEKNLHAEASHADGHALHSDEVKFGGATFTMPGGLYTFVFIVLAVVTLIEIVLAESGLPAGVTIPLLSALSIGKAVLVVLYYMHLLQDSRIFAYAFGIPLAMASIIVLFVMYMQPNMPY